MATQTNWTQTYLAAHRDDLAHDAVQRYLAGDRVSAHDVWTHVQTQLVRSPQGYIIFDDSVLDKNHARQMALVRKQWSGNEKRAIRGIGLVSCVYVNPATQQHWLIDYRIFAPDDDGKGKLEHVTDMLQRCLERDAAGTLPFRGVLMDTWYAVNRLMLSIHRRGKVFCCPIKGNRGVAVVPHGEHAVPSFSSRHQRADTLRWCAASATSGQQVHLRECPSTFTVRLFRVALSTERTELVVTNDPTLLDTNGVRMTHAVRWKVEVAHRELKQLTGIEHCQCRLGRAQRNHIGCSLLIWARLHHLAMQAGCTMYALKAGLLHDYMCQQLRTLTLTFA